MSSYTSRFIKQKKLSIHVHTYLFVGVHICLSIGLYRYAYLKLGISASCQFSFSSVKYSSCIHEYPNNQWNLNVKQSAALVQNQCNLYVKQSAALVLSSVPLHTFMGRGIDQYATVLFQMMMINIPHAVNDVICETC